MRSLTDQLAGYAAYHRDQRNIVTHLIGIPMIVVALAILLSRPTLLLVGPISISPALLAVAWAVIYYLRLDVRFGLVMGLVMFSAVWLGQQVAALPTNQWLACGVGLFVVGWIFQFVGHFFEGRKPAFVDDIIGLIIGPLFVVAEVGFWLGLRKSLQAQIEARLVAADQSPANSSP